MEKGAENKEHGSQELDLFTESGDVTLICTVDRITYVPNDTFPNRIYGKDIDLYEPVYDVTGTEVFNEEWKLLKYNTKCKKCGKEVYWKDIKLTRFKFKSPSANLDCFKNTTHEIHCHFYIDDLS